MLISRRDFAPAAMPALLVLLQGCFSPTPFSRDVEETDLNAKNLERLEPPSSGNKSIRFAAISDTHAEYDDLNTTVRALNTRDDLQFIAHMGDQTDFGQFLSPF